MTASTDSRRGNYRRSSPTTKTKVEKLEIGKTKSKDREGVKVQTKTKASRSESPTMKSAIRPPRTGSFGRADSLTRESELGRMTEETTKKSPDTSDEESGTDRGRKNQTTKRAK